MAYFTTTLTTAASSTPGVSTAANLDWIGGKPISVNVLPSTTGTSSGFFTLQFTLDDLQRSSAPSWSNVSSADGQPGTVFSSSTTGVDGLFYRFLSPVAGLRISSTGLTSGPLTLKVLQGEGG